MLARSGSLDVSLAMRRLFWWGHVTDGLAPSRLVADLQNSSWSVVETWTRSGTALQRLDMHLLGRLITQQNPWTNYLIYPIRTTGERGSGSSNVFRQCCQSCQYLLQRLRQAEFTDENSVRVNQRRCKASDTVQRSVSKLRGPSASDKNKNNHKNWHVARFQRLNC